MNCERVRNLISAYLDRELSPEESRLVRAHLVNCAACHAELKEEAAVKEALGALASLEVPEDFVPSLMARLSCERVEDRWRPWICALRWGAVGAAAAVLLAWPLVRYWRSVEYVIEANPLYRQHTLASAARPLADEVATSYYYAMAGGTQAGLGTSGVAERVKLVGQSLSE
ncbi:MAG: anti-sigma factor family protein [Betaproteobacteria bacterium]